MAKTTKKGKARQKRVSKKAGEALGAQTATKQYAAANQDIQAAVDAMHQVHLIQEARTRNWLDEFRLSADA
jgi:hypothetical protein